MKFPWGKCVIAQFCWVSQWGAWCCFAATRILIYGGAAIQTKLSFHPDMRLGCPAQLVRLWAAHYWLCCDNDQNKLIPVGDVIDYNKLLREYLPVSKLYHTVYRLNENAFSSTASWLRKTSWGCISLRVNVHLHGTRAGHGANRNPRTEDVFLSHRHPRARHGRSQREGSWRLCEPAPTVACRHHCCKVHRV